MHPYWQTPKKRVKFLTEGWLDVIKESVNKDGEFRGLAKAPDATFLHAVYDTP